MRQLFTTILVFISFTLFAQTTYTCEKGKHDFTPNRFNLYKNESVLYYRVVLDSAAIYSLPYPDSHDWNKGGGLSEDIFSNTRWSVMWAWRWNSEFGLFELAAYFHVAGKRIIPKSSIYYNEETSHTVFPGEPFFVKVVRDRDDAEYSVYFLSEYGIPLTQHTITTKKPAPWLTREIGMWFGGTSTAPNKLRAQVEISRYWKW